MSQNLERKDIRGKGHVRVITAIREHVFIEKEATGLEHKLNTYFSWSPLLRCEQNLFIHTQPQVHFFFMILRFLWETSCLWILAEHRMPFGNGFIL